MHAIARGSRTHTVRESELKVDSGREKKKERKKKKRKKKNPCRTGDSNSCQYCVRLFQSNVQPAELIVQELCESRGGRPGLSVLTSLLVSVDVKIY